MTLSICFRHAGLFVMMLDIPRPAMLKDLLGEFMVIVLSWSIVAIGVKWYPGISSSQWISSLTTMTPLRRQISATFWRSSLGQTLPQGLWGLQNRRTLAIGSAALLSRSSKSMYQVAWSPSVS